MFIFINMRTYLILAFLFISLLLACDDNPGENENNGSIIVPISNLNYVFVNSYPHDITAFTEGLLFHNGEIFESTGSPKNLPHTKSLFGILDLENGNINVKVKLDRDKYFGEGITFLTGKVFQLTYDTKVGFIYDAISYKELGQFTIPTNEGWGLTTDGENLIMSDGSDVLTYMDPESLKVVKKVTVTQNGAVRNYLNELEYINGYIFANIYTTNYIVKIDPVSGKVIGKLDLSRLTEEAKSIYPGSMELNGIAYDSVTRNIFVTGKMWPKIYEIKITN